MVFQVGAVDEMLFDAVLEHALIIPSPLFPNTKSGLHSVQFPPPVAEHGVEPARGWRDIAAQKVLRRPQQALALLPSDACRWPAKGQIGPMAHLNKHQNALGIAKNEIDFSAEAPGRSIIARQQSPPERLQPPLGAGFDPPAYRDGAGSSCLGVFSHACLL